MEECPQGSSPPPKQSWADLRRDLAALWMYLTDYLAARSDAVRARIRIVVLGAAVVVAAAVIAASVVVAAAVLLVLGIAHGFSALFGSHWAGELLAGGGLLIAMAGGAGSGSISCSSVPCVGLSNNMSDDAINSDKPSGTTSPNEPPPDPLAASGLSEAAFLNQEAARAKAAIVKSLHAIAEDMPQCGGLRGMGQRTSLDDRRNCLAGRFCRGRHHAIPSRKNGAITCGQ